MCLTWFTHEICLEWTVCWLVISQFVVISQLFLFLMQKEPTTQLFPHLQNPMLLACLCSPQFLIFTLTCFNECCILILKTIKENVYSSYICNRSKIIKIFFYLWLIPGLGQESETGYYPVTTWEVCATVKQWHLLDYFITAHRISREKDWWILKQWREIAIADSTAWFWYTYIKKILSKSMQ